MQVQENISEYYLIKPTENDCVSTQSTQSAGKEGIRVSPRNLTDLN